MANFIGIDIGTQGVRVILVDQNGVVMGSEEEKWPLTEESRIEQVPEEWWQACRRCLGALLQKRPASVRAISVTGTSGTVIPLDAGNNPLHAAIMYSDPRQENEGRRCREIALVSNPGGYTAFNTTSGLSKMVWYAERHPELAARISTWIHAADFIIGKLSGNYGMTDYTNALKSGYDCSRSEWPAFMTEQLPIRKEWLQKVVPSGTPIGTLIPELAALWGLPSTQVVAGMTDGCASQVASGAVNPGDWNTTIGTTLVIKGVTHREVKDPLGRIYCHRHPQGYWMPGGASNTGADWIAGTFGADLSALNAAAATMVPTGFLVYPLQQQGERFPFISKHARGFSDPGITTPEELFAAGMEGVACIERLAYELIEELSGEAVNTIYTAGGGSNSAAWLKIRANVLNRRVCRPAATSGAMGAAIMAASRVYYQSLQEAATAMTTVTETVEPEAEKVKQYEVQYQKFVNELKMRGYLT